jgi:hypothetical protein
MDPVSATGKRFMKYTPKHMKMRRIVRMVPTESERVAARNCSFRTVKKPWLKHPEHEMSCCCDSCIMGIWDYVAVVVVKRNIHHARILLASCCACMGKHSRKVPVSLRKNIPDNGNEQGRQTSLLYKETNQQQHYEVVSVAGNDRQGKTMNSPMTSLQQ